MANLAINENDARNTYTSTGGSVFAYTFPTKTTDDIRVAVNGTDLVYATGFTFTGLGDASGGEVTITAGTTSGDTVSIWLDLPIKRETGFTEGAAVLTAQSLNDELAERTRVDQMLRARVNRCVRLADTDPRDPAGMLLPDPTGELLYLALDDEGAITGRQVLDPTVSSLAPAQLDANTALLAETVTSEAKTWYVNASTGLDTNSGEAVDEPFLTLNKALSSVARLIKRGQQQTIELADGTYNQSSIAAADLSRPAIGWITELLPGDRTAASGSDLVGSLIIKGESKAGTIIETTDEYTYGIYCSQVKSIGVQDLTIRAHSNNASALLVSHRGGYVQANNVILDGQGFTTTCAVAEAGGIMEITGASQVIDAQIGIQSFANCTVVVSNTTQVSGHSLTQLTGAGYISLNNEVTVTGFSTFANMQLIMNGSVSTRVTYDGSINAYGGYIDCTYATFTGVGALVDLTNVNTKLNVVDWSGQIIQRAGDFFARNVCNSFVSPATASTVAFPLVFVGDVGFWAAENTLNINGSGGYSSIRAGVRDQAVAANGTEIDYQASGGRTVTTEITSASDYTGCTLPAASSDTLRTPVEGAQWSIIHTGANSVQLVDSAAGSINGGAVTLGSGVDMHSGIGFKYVDGKWREDSRSGSVSVSLPAYTPSNVTTTRTFNADATSVEELADVLGTLLDDLGSIPMPTYTPSNVTTTRTFDANLTSVDELADVLGTLLADLDLT